ncbi:prepilin peptidase [Candidatus Woesearchaeota archaeon]|jgi:Flp pilus assembly protein protease CpaA|nr:prepilin peptidase [Candidatus Woesearchaeota archaeon]MBT6518383.1 prepilin peptidase [Candidatus Woesearchaeota archaeon]MBT7366837.1 prepilin peptidase [Candidatus Woesearchaeota archaeon]
MLLIDQIMYSIALITLLVGSFTDFKFREVPDWVSYSLVFIALGIRSIFAIVYEQFAYLQDGIIGFLIFLAIALIMFYTGQWGGGDSKLLIGLGALIGVKLRMDTFMVGFFVNLIVVGAIYGLLYSFYLIYKEKGAFFSEFKKSFGEKKVQFFIVLGLVVLFTIGAFFVPAGFSIPLFLFGLILLIAYLVMLLLVSVEKSCMIKSIEPEELTEGDWIAQEIKVGAKLICGPKDLGICKKQIAELIKLKKQKKINKILVKEGIPFVPTFLLSFIVTYFFKNWLFKLLGF